MTEVDQRARRSDRFRERTDVSTLPAPRSTQTVTPPAGPEFVRACWATMLMDRLGGSSALRESAVRHEVLGALRQVINTAVPAGPGLALVDVRRSAAVDALAVAFSRGDVTEAVRRTAEATEFVLDAVVAAVGSVLPEAAGAQPVRRAMAAVLEASSAATVELVSYLGDPARATGVGIAGRRADAVRRVLAGSDLSREEQDRLLRYDLRADHVAVVVLPTGEPRAPGASDLAADTLRRLGCQRTLVVADPSGAGFGWGADGRLEGEALPGRPSTVATWSGPHRGALGFRDAHREAVAAASFLRDAGRSGVCLSSRPLALPAVLGVDQQRTRTFIRHELGVLAEGGGSRAEWRSTLLAYLDAGRSPAVAAKHLHVARNTVNYRITRAVALLPGPLADRQLEIHVALRLQRALGTA